jgi:murein DD-endopeptidase MepM/ murein hydrolase activator NlpD
LFVLVFAVVLAVPALPAPAVDAASLKDQIAAAKERQAELTESISKSQKLVDQLRRDEDSTRDELAATKDDLKDIRADQVAVKASIEKTQERIERIEERHVELVDEQRQTDFTLGLLEQELANGEADLKARREALSVRIVEANRSESTPLIEQVFTAKSFSEVLTETSANLSYGDQEAQLAQQITQDQQALDSLRLLTTSTRLKTDQLRRATLETKVAVSELRRKLKSANQRLKQLEKATKKAREQQKFAIQRIAANKKQAMAMVAKQQAARNTLMRNIRNKVAAMQARATAQFGGVAPTGSSGRFDWPTRGSIAQGYGCTGYYINPPRPGCSHFHDGIDISNGSGTPILAAADGVVAFIGWNPYEYDPAFIVVIAHGGGISTLYAHMLPTYPVGVGQSVRKGQRIGSMGNTGGSFGSHLHFEVWVGGDWQPVNPYAYLP